MTTRFGQFIPVWWPDPEHGNEIDSFCELYFDAQDAGLDPVAAVDWGPDGDVFSFEYEDDNEEDE